MCSIARESDPPTAGQSTTGQLLSVLPFAAHPPEVNYPFLLHIHCLDRSICYQIPRDLLRAPKPMRPLPGPNSHVCGCIHSCQQRLPRTVKNLKAKGQPVTVCQTLAEDMALWGQRPRIVSIQCGQQQKLHVCVHASAPQNPWGNAKGPEGCCPHSGFESSWRALSSGNPNLL